MTIDRGLYLLRYVTTTSPQAAPLVHVRASYGSEDLLQFLAAPGGPATSLSRPGTALVIRAEAPANLQITVQATTPGNLDAELRLEPVDGTQKDGIQKQEQTFGGTSPVPATRRDLEVIAHVSRRGDLSAGPGQWIAGPDAPTPIEGLAARWSGRAQDLEYQCLVEGSASWSEWTGGGRFVGTRGEHRGLTGLRVRLTGDGPCVLRASALFLGATVTETSGPSIELRSASGRDPLVGLCLEIQEASSTMSRPAPMPIADRPAPEPERRGRVRVFRAGGENH